jgi:hypothetical protein
MPAKRPHVFAEDFRRLQARKRAQSSEIFERNANFVRNLGKNQAKSASFGVGNNVSLCQTIDSG